MTKNEGIDCIQKAITYWEGLPSTWLTGLVLGFLKAAVGAAGINTSTGVGVGTTAAKNEGATAQM